MLKPLSTIFVIILLVGCDQPNKNISVPQDNPDQNIDRIVEWKYSVQTTNPEETMLKIEASIKDGWMLYTSNKKSKGPVPAKFSYSNSSGLIGTTNAINPQSKYDTLFECNTSYFVNQAKFNQTLQPDFNTSFDVYITYQVEALANGLCPIYTDTLRIDL